MKNYIFFIGGSGARVYKALMHAGAAGILQTSEISTMMIDADEANKANTECITLYGEYKKIHDIISTRGYQTDIFSCDITMKCEKVVSPLRSSVNRLQESIGNVDENRKRMLKALYTEEERIQELKGGFYAHPNIGCVFFSDFDSTEFTECMEDIGRTLSDNKTVNIILVGSIFGGTGAAGIPTIYKLIHKQFKGLPYFDKLRIGGVFLTPYFKTLGKRQEDNENIPVNMEEFYFNTYEALSYYQNNTDMKFHSIYLVGQQELDVVNLQYADSGEKQDNKAHITELYAALAIDRFFCSSGTGVFGYVRGRELDWNSFPYEKDENRVLRLADFARAQAFMVAEIYPYVYQKENIPTKIFRNLGIMIPQWYAAYKLKDTSPSNKEEMEIMKQYSIEFVKWLYFLNSTYDTYGEEEKLVADTRIKLFSSMLEDLYEVSVGLSKKESESNESMKSKLKVIRDKFDSIVDTASNVEFVLNKIGVIASLAGIFTGSGTGAVGLLTKVVSLVSQKGQ